MLKKLIQSLRRPAPDPRLLAERFEDPLARETEWTPARGGGASFRTHVLRQQGAHRIEFAATPGALVFYLIFLLTGVLTVLGAIGSALFGSLAMDENLIPPLLFGGIFGGVGGVFYYFGTQPIVFDKRTGYFWKGRGEPREWVQAKARKSRARLDQLYALQLLSEYVSGNKNSYYSYELNLVLRDGRRINVVDHGSLPKLRADAEKLSSFLGLPVWDAVES